MNAITAAQNCGILFVPATGRGSVSAVRALESVPGLRWFITSNGAVVEDTDQPDQTIVRAMTAGVANRAVDLLRSGPNDYSFAWLTSEGFGAEEGFRHRHSQFLSRRHVEMAAEFNPRDVDLIKVLISGTHRNPLRLLASVVDDLDHMLTVEPAVTVAGSDATFVEMTGHGINKGSALELLCGQLGIGPGQVVALGDEHNDLQMLEWAGYPVAMANAVEAVHDVSSLQTKNNDDDGVAIIIEQILEGTFETNG